MTVVNKMLELLQAREMVKTIEIWRQLLRDYQQVFVLIAADDAAGMAITQRLKVKF